MSERSYHRATSRSFLTECHVYAHSNGSLRFEYAFSNSPFPTLEDLLRPSTDTYCLLPIEQTCTFFNGPVTMFYGCAIRDEFLNTFNIFTDLQILLRMILIRPAVDHYGQLRISTSFAESHPWLMWRLNL